MLDLSPLRDALPASITLDQSHADDAPLIRVPARAADGSPAQVTLVGPALSVRITDAARAAAALAATTALDHPALLVPSAVGVAGERGLFFVTPEPSGASIRSRVGALEGVSAVDVARLGVEVAGALAFVHERQLVHGLVRPESIAWDGTGRTQLLDVGLVPALRAGGVPSTEIVRVLLAGAYAPPELLRDGPPDPRSDVYSLGVSLYELLTGRPPFGGRTTTTVLATVLADEPALLTTDGHQVPGHTVEALLRAIEKSADDRWPTAAAFADALAQGALDAAPRGASSADARAAAASEKSAPRFGCLPLIVILAVSAMRMLHPR